MNIAFILHNLATAGGIERTMTDKANFLASQGHRVTIVTYEQGLHPLVFNVDPTISLANLNCPYFTLYKYSTLKRIYKVWQMKRLFLKRLKSLLHDIKPDLLVMTTYEDKFRKEIMAAVDDIKVVVESHTAFVHDYQSGNMLRRLYLKQDLHYIKKCDLLLALTRRDADCWRKIVNNVACATNPVTKYCDDVDSSIKEEGRIISVGRLHSQKRFDRLIAAFSILASKHPMWHLEIFGGGAEKDKLQELIAKYGLEKRVGIHGPSQNIYSEYIKSQFLVMSSDYEGFPLVLIEAMACGLPVVSTDCPCGPSEIIDNGETGLLAKMDVSELASKMEWMITHEKERVEMGRKAHLAAAKYKKDVVMKEWEEAYLSVLFSKKG